MHPDRWKRIEALLDAALDLAPHDRSAYLERECVDEPDLIREVSSILAAGEGADSVLDASAVHVAAPMLVDDLPASIPERVGAYRIERVIGEGGMGTVYLAHRDDGEFDQRVALKLVRRGLHLDARIIRRFRDERQILSALNHPGIARLLDGGLTSDGLPFFAMEYVEGQSIDKYCDTRKLAVEQVLELFTRVCDALAHAHTKQIVHRDIKPSNILVTETGAPHLLDFGIAKLLAPDESGDAATALTRRSERLLTPEYASPEQIRGEAVVVASDVYCLGVLLYELLTGQRPFRRSKRSPHELERAVLEEDPTRPSEVVDREPLRRRLKGDLDTIVLTAMNREPELRYPSAVEMADDIRRHLAGQPVLARGTAPFYRLRRWARRHRLALTLGAAAAGITAIAGIFVERATIPRRYVFGTSTRIPVDPDIALDAEISPDGKRLAFVAGSGTSMHIFVRDLSTGRVTPLGNDVPGYQRLPRWAPDGTHLAVMAESRIYDVQLDGKFKLLVAPDSGAAFVAFPAWSPDAKSLAYVQDESILIRDLATGTARRLTGVPRTPHSLRWSPNGKFLALVSGNIEFTAGTYPWVSVLNIGNGGQSSIWVIPVTGKDTVRVSDAVGRALNVAPAWTPDSRGLLYVSNRDGTRDVYRVDIDARGHRIGDPVRLTTGLLPHTISLSSDGQTIGFSVFRLIANIWSVTPSASRPAGEPLPLTRGAQSVEGISLSPDGRMLAFDSDRNGNQDIYTISSTGGEAHQLTSDPFDEFMPTWSPDGRELAYHAFGITGLRQLRVVSANGGTGSTVIERPLNQRQPAWSPDGRSLVFDAGRGPLGDVYVIDRDSSGKWGTPRVVATKGGAARWSPDGQRILYVRPDGIFTTSPAGGDGKQVLAVDPAAHLRLGNAQWSADGRRIFFKRFDGEGRTSFWSISSAGGTPHLEVQLNRDLKSHRSEFATDGSRFYFTLTERASEVWTTELRTVR